MFDLGIKITLCYLLGSINGSMLLGWLLGKSDIRKVGSGNAGATNAYRTFGRLYGLTVFFIDISKGVIAVLILAPMLMLTQIDIQQIYIQYLCGLAALFGHISPIWHDYRGGKGVATAVAIVAALHPLLGITAIILWALALLVSRYVCIASTLAAFSVLIVSYYLNPDFWLQAWLLCISFVILFMHRSNFEKLQKGIESKI